MVKCINTQWFSKITIFTISSVQFSCSVVFDSLQPRGLQHAKPPCSSSAPGIPSNSCPQSQWWHPAISSSVIHFSSCLQSFHNQGLFKWVSSLHQVAKVLQFHLQHQHQSWLWIFRTDFLQDGLVGSPYCPGDSQESSPAPQFRSFNSSALSFLHSPTLTSIHGHWKNHSFD